MLNLSVLTFSLLVKESMPISYMLANIHPIVRIFISMQYFIHPHINLLFFLSLISTCI